MESSCYWKPSFEKGPELLQNSCCAQGVMKHAQCGFQALSNESLACFYHTTELGNSDVSSHSQCQLLSNRKVLYTINIYLDLSYKAGSVWDL